MWVVYITFNLDEYLRLNYWTPRVKYIMPHQCYRDQTCSTHHNDSSTWLSCPPCMVVVPQCHISGRSRSLGKHWRLTHKVEMDQHRYTKCWPSHWPWLSKRRKPNTCFMMLLCDVGQVRAWCRGVTFTAVYTSVKFLLNSAAPRSSVRPKRSSAY